MTNERIVDLVNGELDGTNSSNESAELAGILPENEQARVLFDETKALFGALGTVPEVDPPAELKGRIMEFVEREAASSRAHAPGAAQPSLTSSLRSAFEPIFRRPAWAVSYAFAAGLLVGIAIWSIAVNPMDSTQGATQATIGQPAQGILDEASLQVGDITVDLATVGLEQEIVLDVTISGSGDSKVTIQANNGSNEGTSIIASGPGHFTVSLDKTDDLVVIVSSAGQEGSVRLLTQPA